MTKWNTDIGAPDYLSKKAGCGENRFVGVRNFMDIFLTPGCKLEIRPRDAVLTNVRIAWTLNEFYADGGTDKFADRVAAALNIHKSRVKVVAVYEGSVKIQYFIMAEPADKDPIATIEKLKVTISAKIKANEYDLGGGKILSSDLGDGIDVLAVPTIENFNFATLSAGGRGAEDDTVSMSSMLTSFALAVAPTVVFMARTPAVMEMLGDLYE